jgi:hypothetical protein
MMKTESYYKFFLILSIVLLFSIFSSCKKEGTGGKSSVSGYVNHHSLRIPNATIYIKFGATEFPGSNAGSYDASVTADPNGFYSITGLQKGDYYLYGVGYDSNISLPVTGGVAVELKRNKHTDANVPVTE